MVVLTKQDVRNDFADRLAEVMDEIADAPKGRGRTVWLGRKANVSSEMARKWLSGEALPNQARVDALADLFGVRRAWLRDGEGSKKTSEPEPGARSNSNRVAEVRSVTAYGVTVSEDGMLFAAEWEKLDLDARRTIEQLVGMLVGRTVREERKRKHTDITGTRPT